VTELLPGTPVIVNDYYPFPKPLDGRGSYVKGPDGDGLHTIAIQGQRYMLKRAEFDVAPPQLLSAVQLPAGDAVAHPNHYTNSPAKCSNCGHSIECIDITQHQGFNLGNVTKYVWRCDLKRDAIEDLRKARQYLEFEIEKREREAA
jgi:hypothetical protein